MTSRMCGWSARIMSRRSTPSPTPPVGGMPYSSARMKSSSSCCASGSPAARSRACCSRSEEHTSELQSQSNLVCRLLLEKKIQQVFALDPPNVVEEQQYRHYLLA